MPNINYSKAQLEKDSMSRSHIIKELYSIQKEYSIEKMNIIELGSGIGDNLRVFSDNNYVFGVDGIEDAVNYSRSNGIPATVMDLDKTIDLPTETYDCVLCLDVLEHLNHPERLLFEMKRILKQNGLIILNVPNHLNLRGRLKLLFGSGLDVHKYYPDKNDWNNPHIRFFRRDNFIEIINSAGFHILDDRSYRFYGLWGAGIVMENKLFTRLSRVITKMNPTLFAGGIFIIAQKSPSADIT